MEEKGIIHNAFYKRNTRGGTENTLWGRTRRENLEIFEYSMNKEGKIEITEKQRRRKQ